MAKFSMEKDPEVYQKKLTDKAPNHRRILGLDLGRSCGVCFADFEPGQKVEDLLVYMDQWDLSIGSYDSSALRHIRLRQFLSVLQPDLVGFEEVKYDAPLHTFQGLPMGAIIARVVPTAEFLGGLKTTLGVWCEERKIPLHGYPITVIKKRACGKGNASKVEMIRAINVRFHCQLEEEDFEKTGTDNIADAAAVLAMTLEDYSQGL
jgi:crossover junction endodeoxyribonuclease RuvC